METILIPRGILGSVRILRNHWMGGGATPAGTEIYYIDQVSLALAMDFMPNSHHILWIAKT